MSELKPCGCSTEVPYHLPFNKTNSIFICVGCSEGYDLFKDSFADELVSDYAAEKPKYKYTFENLYKYRTECSQR